MAIRIRITEYLDMDLDQEMWCCNRCGTQIAPARDNYKTGCLIYNRDPRTIYEPVTGADHDLSPDPAWCRLVEFYCPGCGTMMEVESLPPSHPITHDIRLDIEKLKAKYLVQEAG